eukprot:gnl/MRDRNA2_/MRDRNA2_77596_c0_seq1.p1 gnl/MRDRNA2_/MRDRNA2_77596_c0~~gnl/MRDRNA2_/MRDRNA2_77596_c0_seq1.p1  ORF type:complete len:1168 (+),score=172.51 gnl/MRDRNA2_/MRDRNA2_77596_c0_seq1:115-3504(+)
MSVPQSHRGSIHQPVPEHLIQTWPTYGKGSAKENPTSRSSSRGRTGSRGRAGSRGRTGSSRNARLTDTPRRQDAACALWERVHNTQPAKAKSSSQDERLKTTGYGGRWTSLARKKKAPTTNSSARSDLGQTARSDLFQTQETIKDPEGAKEITDPAEEQSLGPCTSEETPTMQQTFTVEHPPTLTQTVPEIVCLEGSPMRRPGAKRVLSNVAEDRLLYEYGAETGSTEFLEDNEDRLEVQYYRNCSKLCTLPSRLKCLSSISSGGSSDANLVSQASELTPEKVIAIGHAVASRAQEIRCIDLSGSRLLTDDPLCKFIASIKHGCTNLRELRLDDTKLGRRGLHELSSAMSKSFHLECLSLSGVSIADDSWPTLCRSVASSGDLRSLNLTNTTCGMWQQYACAHVASMLSQAKSLLELSLSQNHFRKVGLEALATGLTDTNLEILRLNDNGCGEINNVLATIKAVEGDDKPNVWHPIVSFCEALRQNTSLTEIEMNNSQLNTMAAVCLEDAFLCHPRIKRVDVGRNPFGEFGLRSILRSAIRQGSSVENIVVSGFRDDVDVPELVFNYGDLTEDYCKEKALPLESPYARAICRLLLNRIDDFGQAPGDCMQKFKMNNESRRTLPFTKNAEGHWQIPSSGKAEFDFVLIQDSQVKDADELMIAWQNSRRIPVSMKRFVSVVQCWRSLICEAEHRMFVDAVGKDCLLKPAQMRLFVEDAATYVPALVPRITSRLMLALQVVDRQCVNSTLKSTGKKTTSSNDMHQGTSRVSVGTGTTTVSATMGAFKKNQKSYGPGADQSLSYMSSLLRFNPQNCSGRYRLDLADPGDYTVAERLLVINNWEGLIARARKTPDTSQGGGYHAIRNIKLDSEGSEEFLYTSSWMLPGDGFTGEGKLQLDYVTLARVDPSVERPLSPEQFNTFLSLFKQQNTDVLEVSVFLALKLVSHKLVLLAHQLGEMLRCIHQVERRLEAYCYLWPRCLEYGPPLVDTEDGVLGSKPGIFNEGERASITQRLGLIHTLDVRNIHKPPKNVFALDLTKNDQHMLVELLIILAEIEPGENMMDCHWTEYSNRTSGLWFVPASWIDELPYKGVVTITYVLEKPAYLRMDSRKDTAQKICGWLVTDFGKYGGEKP